MTKLSSNQGLNVSLGSRKVTFVTLVSLCIERVDNKVTGRGSCFK